MDGFGWNQEFPLDWGEKFILGMWFDWPRQIYDKYGWCDQISLSHSCFHTCFSNLLNTSWPDMAYFWVMPQIYIFHIYTGPKFTKPRFSQNPDLHQLKFTQLRFTHTQIYTAPYWHTQIYTTQIYTKLNPNLHNPNLHKTRIYKFINPWLVQKRLLPCSRLPRAALEV